MVFNWQSCTNVKDLYPSSGPKNNIHRCLENSVISKNVICEPLIYLYQGFFVPQPKNFNHSSPLKPFLYILTEIKKNDNHPNIASEWLDGYWPFPKKGTYLLLTLILPCLASLTAALWVAANALPKYFLAISILFLVSPKFLWVFHTIDSRWFIFNFPHNISVQHITFSVYNNLVFILDWGGMLLVT